MKRNLKIFFLLSRYSIKTMIQHRVGAISFITGKLIRFSLTFLFIYFLVSKTRLLAGYTLQQTLIFFLTFNFIDSFVQLLFREVYRFRPLIVSGEFDNVLVKPYHPFIRILIGGLDILDGFTMIPYFLILFYFVSQIRNIHLSHILLYIGFIINAIIVAAGFHIIILAVGILTTEVDNITLMYRDFTKMVSIPIDIYREPLRSILMFVIPVGIMMAVPVKMLLGLYSTNLFIMSIVISALFVIFSYFLWNKALHKYQSWGG
ncbi:ABC-2 family transporter protein [Candidatus Roizmanbacteria bacterium]|nr:ABC-2 family transporter protein [Candidatus Roizmanbacteria bacterium]